MMYDTLVVQFTKMLGNLNNFLDKSAQFADAKKFQPEVLLNSRLAPDQFPLMRQIQIACDTAKLASARLTGVEAPVFEDKETTLPEIKERIANTIKYLQTLKPANFENARTKQITNPRWEGKHMMGEDYANEHAIPNFYFHMTTAYAILRHNGVDLGKKDFLGTLSLK
ncbi:DUF1993 domain-containing protein [Bdellovibrio sp. ZAP7]|uniref:DUF1993 domain-containing protein n=1 Tax=Bdellovibrio sp. ZAP7 TaxID=2231053 RepID=UPI001156CE54|nr:DUF1993 domain-containing protein [Bdellovibrio sp. ZAP7]QDK45416.1 DUF1993 domain-containing protein [Bdellovibrio sp. ZAP7]